MKVVVGGYLSKGKQSWACYGAALNKHNHQKNTLGCYLTLLPILTRPKYVEPRQCLFGSNGMICSYAFFEDEDDLQTML